MAGIAGADVQVDHAEEECNGQSDKACGDAAVVQTAAPVETATATEPVAESAPVVDSTTPDTAHHKKKGLFGKAKSVMSNKIVKAVVKTAACTMVPGGQAIAGAIDAASSKSAGEAAQGAAGAATGSSCMPGMGGMGGAGMTGAGMEPAPGWRELECRVRARRRVQGSPVWREPNSPAPPPHGRPATPREWRRMEWRWPAAME